MRLAAGIAGWFVLVWAAVNMALLLGGEVSPRWTRFHRAGRRLLPPIAALMLIAGLLDGDQVQAFLDAASVLVLWWTGDDGDGMRRMIEWGRGVVTRRGNRLAVVDGS